VIFATVFFRSSRFIVGECGFEGDGEERQWARERPRCPEVLRICCVVGLVRELDGWEFRTCFALRCERTFDLL
jgi:hypothetical protein